MTGKLVELKIKGVVRTVRAVRLDDSFLCQCGCGRRLKSGTTFSSPACYEQYRKNNGLVRRTATCRCRWCGKVIPKGDSYCSQRCKNIRKEGRKEVNG